VAPPPPLTATPPLPTAASPISGGTLAATTSSAAPGALPGAQASGATPAAQLAPALFSLARSGASNVLTLRLEPATLGQVEVQITRPPDGPDDVKVTATEPETLLLLLRDQPSLQQALDRAGLTLDPQSVSFHLAPSQSASQSAPVAASESARFGNGSGFAAGGTPAGDGSGGQSGMRRSRAGGRQAETQTDSAGAAIPLGALPGGTWLRVGLDITA
jgi:hypothetical protein